MRKVLSLLIVLVLILGASVTVADGHLTPIKLQLQWVGAVAIRRLFRRRRSWLL